MPSHIVKQFFDGKFLLTQFPIGTLARGELDLLEPYQHGYTRLATAEDFASECFLPDESRKIAYTHDLRISYKVVLLPSEILTEERTDRQRTKSFPLSPKISQPRKSSLTSEIMLRYNTDQCEKDSIELERFPSTNFICPVCMGNETDMRIRTLPCGHAAHLGCLASLVKSGNYKCPLCKRLSLEGNERKQLIA